MRRLDREASLITPLAFLLFQLAVRKASIYYTSKCLVFTSESNIKRDAIAHQYYWRKRELSQAQDARRQVLQLPTLGGCAILHI